MRFFLHHVVHAPLIREACIHAPAIADVCRVKMAGPSAVAWVRLRNGRLRPSHIVVHPANRRTQYLTCPFGLAYALTPSDALEALQAEADGWTDRFGPDKLDGDESQYAKDVWETIWGDFYPDLLIC